LTKQFDNLTGRVPWSSAQDRSFRDCGDDSLSRYAWAV